MPAPRMTHLLPPDAALFGQYLKHHPNKYRHIDYDVRVGLGQDPGPAYDPNIRNMAIHLSQRRIDAIGVREGVIDIIEITLQAGLTALGQLIAYPQLYQLSFSPVLPLQPVLVTRRFSPDCSHLYRQHGIDIYLYPQPPL